MGMLDFFNNEAKLEQAKELKRLKAQEKRMIDMLAKYTDLYQRGKNKVQVINVMNDIDKVLGDNNAR